MNTGTPLFSKALISTSLSYWKAVQASSLLATISGPPERWGMVKLTLDITKIEFGPGFPDTLQQPLPLHAPQHGYLRIHGVHVVVNHAGATWYSRKKKSQLAMVLR